MAVKLVMAMEQLSIVMHRHSPSVGVTMLDHFNVFVYFLNVRVIVRIREPPSPPPPGHPPCLAKTHATFRVFFRIFS
jgi:hypothetical protein